MLRFGVASRSSPPAHPGLCGGGRLPGGLPRNSPARRGSQPCGEGAEGKGGGGGRCWLHLLVAPGRDGLKWCRSAALKFGGAPALDSLCPLAPLAASAALLVTGAESEAPSALQHAGLLLRRRPPGEG